MGIAENTIIERAHRIKEKENSEIQKTENNSMWIS